MKLLYALTWAILLQGTAVACERPCDLGSALNEWNCNGNRVITQEGEDTPCASDPENIGIGTTMPDIPQEDAEHWFTLTDTKNPTTIVAECWENTGGDDDNFKCLGGLKEVRIITQNGNSETISFDRSGNRTDKGCE